MAFFTRYFNACLAIVICFLAAIACLINHYFTQYPGNNYFPPEALGIAAILVLIFLGAYLLFDKNSSYFLIAQELVFFFLVISVVALATNATQFTPFKPIDRQLIAIDEALGIHLKNLVHWIINHPTLRKLLGYSYDSLPSQLVYLPLILIFAKKFSYLREFYSLILITTLLGFVFYYFWPTIGPASIIGGPYFTATQFATGIKFAEIHQGQVPSTIEGGMIAMPSFHAIWALLCLNLTRCLPLLCLLLLPLNLLLVASCVLLGWHYFIDLFGSLIVLIAAYCLYRYPGKH